LPHRKKNAILCRRYAALLYLNPLQSLYTAAAARVTASSSIYQLVRAIAPASPPPTSHLLSSNIDIREHLCTSSTTPIESAQQPAHAALQVPALIEQSNGELSLAEQLGIDYVQSYPFAADARVAGYLTKADIGPTSYGSCMALICHQVRTLSPLKQ
jgi:hypothetical protein